MGKSEKGAVMLDPTLTSPYDFYQYWLNDDDVLVVQHLKWLTLMTADEVAADRGRADASPGDRPAQKALAFDLTARVHGREEAERQVRVAEAAFSGAPITDPEVLDALFDAMDHFEFGPEEAGLDALGFAVASGLYPSRSEARRQIEQGGLSINDARVAALDAPLPEPIDGRYLVLRAGKKRLLIARRRSWRTDRAGLLGQAPVTKRHFRDAFRHCRRGQSVDDPQSWPLRATDDRLSQPADPWRSDPPCRSSRAGS